MSWKSKKKEGQEQEYVVLVIIAMQCVEKFFPEEFLQAQYEFY